MNDPQTIPELEVAIKTDEEQCTLLEHQMRRIDRISLACALTALGSILLSSLGFFLEILISFDLTGLRAVLLIGLISGITGFMVANHIWNCLADERYQIMRRLKRYARSLWRRQDEEYEREHAAS